MSYSNLDLIQRKNMHACLARLHWELLRIGSCSHLFAIHRVFWNRECKTVTAFSAKFWVDCWELKRIVWFLPGCELTTQEHSAYARNNFSSRELTVNWPVTNLTSLSPLNQLFKSRWFLFRSTTFSTKSSLIKDKKIIATVSSISSTFCCNFGYEYYYVLLLGLFTPTSHPTPPPGSHKKS